MRIFNEVSGQGGHAAAVSAALKGLGAAKGARIICMFALAEQAMQKLFSEGYANLYGIDPNKEVYDMPHYTLVRYLYGRPENTHFPAGFFDYCFVTEIQRRNADPDALFAEAGRLLKGGGTFIVSGGPAMDMAAMAESSERHGMAPLFDRREATIKTGTPHVMGFRKRPGGGAAKLPRDVTIINYSKGFGGFSEHVRLLKERLEDEYGIRVGVASNSDECRGKNIVIEYTPSVIDTDRLIKDIKSLKRRGCSVFVESHDPLCTKLSLSQRKWLESNTTLMMRANEMADYDSVSNYTLYPLFSFSNKYLERNRPLLGRPMRRGGILLGTFGYASTWKKTDQLIQMANKLGIGLKVLLSISTESSDREQENVKALISRMVARNAGHKNIIIKVGDFTDRSKGSFFEQKGELIDELGECTHYIFALKSRMAPSGTMHFVKRFHRPIIGLESFQARQMQTIRVKFFCSRLAGLADFVYESAYKLAARLLRGRKVEWDAEARFFIALINPLTRPMSLEWFRAHTELSKDEDGLEYLIAILRNSMGRGRARRRSDGS